MIRIWIPQTIVCVLLFWALNPSNSYGCYVFLRYISCAVFTYLAFKAYAQEKESWTWILGAVAVLYNPFFTIHLNRGLWSVVNLITIGIPIINLERVFVLISIGQMGLMRG